MKKNGIPRMVAHPLLYASLLTLAPGCQGTITGAASPDGGRFMQELLETTSIWKETGIKAAAKVAREKAEAEEKVRLEMAEARARAGERGEGTITDAASPDRKRFMQELLETTSIWKETGIKAAAQVAKEKAEAEEKVRLEMAEARARAARESAATKVAEIARERAGGAITIAIARERVEEREREAIARAREIAEARARAARESAATKVAEIARERARRLAAAGA